MTTLEKLCRAACEADGKDPDEIIACHLPDIGEYPMWQAKLHMIKSVLSALEDPSDEMVIAFQEATVNQWATVPGLKKGFTAMIRKAKEG